MRRMKYGAYMEGFKEITPKLIERIAGLGFDFLEMSVGDVLEFDIKEVKSAAESMGLFILTSTGCPYEKNPIGEDPDVRKRGVEYLKHCVRAAAELGAKSVNGYTYSSNRHKPASLDLRKYWEWGVCGFREACEYALDFGIDIGVEAINRYETFFLTTLDQAVDFVKQVNMPNIKAHIDTFHMITEETDYYETIKRTLPYASHFHLAESNRGTIGRGFVPWSEVYRAIYDGGYAVTGTLEAFDDMSDEHCIDLCMWKKYGGDGIQTLKTGIDYLKKVEDHFING